MSSKSKDELYMHATIVNYCDQLVFFPSELGESLKLDKLPKLVELLVDSGELIEGVDVLPLAGNTLRRSRGMGNKEGDYVLTLSGLFYFLYRIDKENAREYRKWLMKNVLPISIKITVSEL